MARDETVKSGRSDGWMPTRREFLGAAAAAVGLWAGPGSGFGQEAGPPTSRPAAELSFGAPWWLNRGSERSRVINVRSEGVLHASAVDRIVLGEMIAKGVRKLTDEPTSEAAWRAVLGSGERIVLKFNSVGAGVINTNDALAGVLVEQIASAGYEPRNIALVEASGFLSAQFGTRPAEEGWGPGIRVGGELEPLARYLHEADAIVNVPQLKTHQIAGMTGCMKNLSHAVIRHPARFHANGCSPYVGQVIGSKAVSSKIRLNVMNAVRAVVNRGPKADEADIVGYGGVVLGYDPVAVDKVGLSILRTERRRLGLESTIAVPHLASAIAMGLGRWRPAEIDLIGLEAPS